MSVQYNAMPKPAGDYIRDLDVLAARLVREAIVDMAEAKVDEVCDDLDDDGPNMTPAKIIAHINPERLKRCAKDFLTDIVADLNRSIQQALEDANVVVEIEGVKLIGGLVKDVDVKLDFS